MNPTKQQPEALKGKCPECRGVGWLYFPYKGCGEDIKPDCLLCQGTGQATIEIKKEWVECNGCSGTGNKPWSHIIYKDNVKLPTHSKCSGKGRIQKYKVGEEIWVDTECEPYTHLGKCEHKVKLKIIGETETEWRVCLG